MATNGDPVENFEYNVTNSSWGNDTGMLMGENPDVIFYFYLWNVACPIAFGLITLLGIVGNALVIHVILSR